MTLFNTARQTYIEDRVTGGRPTDCLVMAYDAAITGCYRRDAGQTGAAIMLLENAIDFRHDESVAMGFLRIYRYCSELVRNEHYQDAARLLGEMRDAWTAGKLPLSGEDNRSAP